MYYVLNNQDYTELIVEVIDTLDVLDTDVNLLLCEDKSSKESVVCLNIDLTPINEYEG